MKGWGKSQGIKSPIFLPGEVAAQYGPSRYLTFEGFSVDETGKQHYLDATVAYRQACLRAIEYLKRFGMFFDLVVIMRILVDHASVKPGYSGEQIYLLLSCAPIKGIIAGIVDIPNACTTLGIPMDIFAFDISPEASMVLERDLGACAYTSDRK